ncbi:MAG: hypothetical protein JWP90_484 [Mycetocola sp.]|nr:hypothetical protein [Mycetocola sp.]
MRLAGTGAFVTMVSMTDISAETARNVPLVTDELIEQRVQALVGRACTRQVWMLFLYADHVQVPLVMPIADYPESPGGGNAESFAASLKEIADVARATQVIFVWERYASDSLTPHDCAWARHLQRACTGEGLPVRAQLLSHKRGVRWIAAEDYLVA